MTIDRREFLGLYYTLQDAAEKLGVGRDWLYKMAKMGYIQPYSAAGHLAVSDADFDSIRDLTPAARGTKFLPPLEKPLEIKSIGLTIDQAAELTGAAKTWVLELVSTGKAPGQQIGKTWLVFEEALPIIRETPRKPRQTREEDQIEYYTHKGNPKVVPELNERYKAIVGMFDKEHKTFAQIGRELGISRERVSRIYATAKRRFELLVERGVIDANGNPIEYNGEDTTEGRLSG